MMIRLETKLIPVLEDRDAFVEQWNVYLFGKLIFSMDGGIKHLPVSRRGRKIESVDSFSSRDK